MHSAGNYMDVDTGDSPPICQNCSPKLYTLALKHYNWVQQEIETLECAGVIKKKHWSVGKSYCHSSQKVLHQAHPLAEECVSILEN